MDLILQYLQQAQRFIILRKYRRTIFPELTTSLQVHYASVEHIEATCTF